MWEHMPPDVAAEVMKNFKRNRYAVSAVFRKVCKGWRAIHDQRVTRLSVAAGDSLPSSDSMTTRFQRLKDIRVRRHTDALFARTCVVDDQWLQKLAELAGLVTCLDLSHCSRVQVADNGIRALASLTAVTNLNLGDCEQVSDDWLHTVAGLAALTSLNLEGCERVSDNGLRALAGLTALTSLDLSRCGNVASEGLCALGGLTGLASLNLRCCQQVTDDGLRALTGLTTLTTCNVGGCNQVSPNGLRTLVELTSRNYFGAQQVIICLLSSSQCVYCFVRCCVSVACVLIMFD
jgi:hypothetical protein